MTERSREGAWIVEPSGRTRYANPAAAALCGHDHDQLMNADVHAVFSAESVAALLSPSGQHDPIVTNAIGIDATRHPVKAWTSTVPDSSGQPWAIVIHLAPHITLPSPLSTTLVATPSDAPDRSDRAHPNESVTSSDDSLMRALSQALPVGIFELDAEMRLTNANPAWRDAVGPFANDAPFAWLGKVHPEDRPVLDAALACVRSGHWFHERYRVSHDIDVWAWVETTVVAIGDSGRHAGICANVSANVAVEEQIAGARDSALETSRLKSDFLANMSHEIRTPLNGVIGMATLLMETPLNRDQRERVLTLRSAGEHLLTLVNDILDFSKVETGKVVLEMVEFDLLPVISQVVSLYSSAGFDKGVRLRVDADSSLPRSVIGDPSRLRQVLSNLVGNAVKFTEQGSVTMRVTAEGKRSSIVRFEVIDTGLGIDIEAQENIFEPFVQADTSTTRRFGGTGLGLPISKRLVEVMGGMLSVNSKVGRGSTFWFTIPFGDPAEIDAPRVESDPHITVDKVADALLNGAARGRILLVEDNPINQKVALGFLTHLGWEADLAGDGSEGFHAAINDTYALVLMDCQMPQMDGYEATAQIRAHERSHGGRVPIIALTAGAMPGDRERCIEAGMDDYLSKPIDVGRLDAILRQWARRNGVDDHATPVAAESFDNATSGGDWTGGDRSKGGHEAGIEPCERLDPVVVDQLRSIHTAGTAAHDTAGTPEGSAAVEGTLLSEALAQFRTDVEGCVDELLISASSRQWPAMSAAAHALKGMSAAIGASRLSNVADALQRAGLAPDPEGVVIDVLLDRLRQAVSATHAAVAHELARHPGRSEANTPSETTPV